MTRVHSSRSANECCLSCTPFFLVIVAPNYCDARHIIDDAADESNPIQVSV